jgi:ribosomal-protein-alanine N-acetyltransferase
MNPPLIPTIRTPNLTLRPLVPADAPSLFRIYQTEGVLRYFPSTTPPPLEKMERFIANQEKHWAQNGCGNWGMLPDGEQEIIGWAGLQFLPELNQTEVGFLLDKLYWGKGYATLAARASLQFGFEQLDLAQIIALVHPDNLASQRVILKCGMEYVETIALWGMELQRYFIKNLEHGLHGLDG